MKRQIGTSTEVIIKADRAQLAQMIVTTEKKTLQMNDILSQPLGPRPWALDSADGVMRRANKSTPACRGVDQKNITAADKIAQPCGRITDGICQWSRREEATRKHSPNWL